MKILEWPQRHLCWRILVKTNLSVRKSRKSNCTGALFVSRKPNFRNSFSLFSNVWQSSGNLVKGKVIPVNKNNLLYPQESVFLSLSKGKHFPIFTDKTHLTPLCISVQKQLKSKKICHSVSHSPVNRFLRITLFISGIFSLIFLYYFSILFPLYFYLLHIF